MKEILLSGFEPGDAFVVFLEESGHDFGKSVEFCIESCGALGEGLDGFGVSPGVFGENFD